MSSAPPVDMVIADDRPAPRPSRPGQQSPAQLVLRGLSVIASLRLTVALFAIAMVLVFAGTLAQMDAGIITVVDTYFWSWVVWVPAQVFVRFGQVFFPALVGPDYAPPSWLGFPLPGGKLLGGLMLVNLLAAHVTRFRAGQTLREVRKGFAAGTGPGVRALLSVFVRRGGVWATHTGLVLLFVGEIGTRVGQVEQRMIIGEGESVAHTQDARLSELAFTDRSDPAVDKVVVVPEELLLRAKRDGTRVSDPALPVDIAVREWFPNSSLRRAAPGEANPATVGLGLEEVAVGRRQTTGVDTKQTVDYPSAYVTLYRKGTGEEIGTYLVTYFFEQQPRQAVPGTAVDMDLRFARYYKPFSVKLEKFTVEFYPGTGKPKNYASRVLVTDPGSNEAEPTTISMNQPMIHRGETYFQASYFPEHLGRRPLEPGEKSGTILQVVRNPVKWLPYAACAVVGFGLCLHFGYYLVKFLARLNLTGGGVARPAAGGVALGLFGGLVAGLFGYGLLRTRARRTVDGDASHLRTEHEPGVSALVVTAVAVVFAAFTYYGGYVRRTEPAARAGLDYRAFAAVPVQDGGRVKPLDTYARITMRQLTHSESVVDPDDRDTRRPALEWVLDLAARSELADPKKSWAARAEVFRVENDQVREMLELPPRKSLRYSLNELEADLPGGKSRREVLDAAANRAEEARKGGATLNLVQNKTVELHGHLVTAVGIDVGAVPAVLPPAESGEAWRGTFSVTRAAEFETRARVEQFAADAFPGQDWKAAIRAMPDAERERFVRAAGEYAAGVRQKALAAALEADPPAAKWRDVLAAYRARDKDQARFDAALSVFAAEQGVAADDLTRAKARLEARLNAAAPFFHVTFGCGLVCLMLAVGWGLLFVGQRASEAVRRVAFRTLVALFVVQTVVLVLRMYLSDRPFVFVTNLYSSAVFIAWGAMLIGLLVERVFPVGVGAFVAAAWGLCGNIIAHGLADAGEDTIQMQEAVLDSTFWLSTHVTTVTAGYAATFVAGFIGLVYIALDVASNVLTKPTTVGSGANARTMSVGRAVGMLMYGVVCFAVLLSFVGTVLGGIWADQSWGRFWGWDPKENGAILIVVWNALILHARWAGLVKDRGIAALAVIGSMVTAWSWFGTNQLGVGLHAYGFSKELALGCAVVWVSHAAAVAVALGVWGYERWAGVRKA